MSRDEAIKAWKGIRGRASAQYKKGILKERFNWDCEDFIKWYLGKDNRCFYCDIPSDEFRKIWGKFYGGNRGKRLEIDRKENSKGYYEENCAKACSLCNCSKSDKMTEVEAKAVGDVIKSIWMERARQKGILE